MGVSMGKTGSSALSEINMTPMIDVLLVLLVIFIIVQMNLQRAFDIQLPVDPKDQTTPPNNESIIMEIAAGSVRINTRPIAGGLPELEGYLREIYRERPNKVIFVKVADNVPYGDVINYIDTARSAGVTVIGAVLTALGEATAGAP